MLQVGPQGKAVGIDHIKELVDGSVANIKKDPNIGQLLETGQLVMVTGDGRKGYEPEAPYDAIHVGAAAPELPQAVSDLLLSIVCLFIIILKVYGVVTCCYFMTKKNSSKGCCPNFD